MDDYQQRIPERPAIPAGLTDEEIGKVFRSSVYGIYDAHLTERQRDQLFMLRQAQEIKVLRHQLSSVHSDLAAARREAERKNRPWIRIILQRVSE